MRGPVGQSSSSLHFVLVHGACHGAWCWYKTVALLQKSGHKATALDLPSCGRDPTDPRTITSIAALADPVVRFFQDLAPTEQVILVGHSFGGIVVTDVMERFPEKIAAAVFVTAWMLPPGDGAKEVVRKMFLHVADKFRSFVITATSIPPGLVDLCYNISPPEDVALAYLSLKPFPSISKTEYQSTHTQAKYGSVPRVFIRCLKDRLFVPEDVQDLWIQSNPPAQVINLESDHSPFFSAVEEFNKTLLQIGVTYASRLQQLRHNL